MEKRRPHYPLGDIKAAFASPDKINRTFSAARGVETLGIDDQTLVIIVAGLTSMDFDKSMTSYADNKTWQDVYKPMVAGRRIYVKFTLDSRKALLLISFKEADT